MAKDVKEVTSVQELQSRISICGKLAMASIGDLGYGFVAIDCLSKGKSAHLMGRRLDDGSVMPVEQNQIQSPKDIA